MNGSSMSINIAAVKSRLVERTVHSVLEQLGVDTFLPYGADNWLISAPYREDRNPSLSIRRSDGLWNDKATGERGDIIDLVRLTKRWDLPTATQLVAESVGGVPDRSQTNKGSTATVTQYDYYDEGKVLLYTVHRKSNKSFFPVQTNNQSGYGPRRVLYHLPEVVAAGDRWVLLVEGEKDADRAGAEGFIATTSPGGSNSWRPEYAESLRDRKVAIIPDNDEPGRKYALTAATSLLGVAAEVRVVELPHLGSRRPSHGLDLSDWFDCGYMAECLKEQILHAPLWTPPESGNGDTTPHFGPSLVVRPLASYNTLTVDWLWHQWLARGKIVIYAGVEGDGKSYSITDIVARLTTGSPMPDGFVPTAACNVLLLIAEDGIEDTVRPRLERHNADVERVQILAAVRQEDDRETMFSLSLHLPLLEDAILEHNIDVIVIDPLSSFLQKANRNDEGAIRDLLTPLTQLADRTGVAIIGVAHMNRPNGTTRRPTQRILGSTAFGAVARQVWMIAPIEGREDQNRRAMGVAKSNLSMIPPALEWSIPEEDAAIVWCGPIVENIEQLLARQGAQSRSERVSPERQDIIDVLMEADTEMTPTEIAEALQKNLNTTKNLLRRMDEDGQVQRPRSGIYTVPDRRPVDSVDRRNHKDNLETTGSMESTGLCPSESVDTAATTAQEKRCDFCHSVLPSPETRSRGACDECAEWEERLRRERIMTASH